MELDRLHVKSVFGLLSGWSILFALSGESISKPIGVTLFTPVFRWDFVSGFLFLILHTIRPMVISNNIRKSTPTVTPIMMLLLSSSVGLSPIISSLAQVSPPKPSAHPYEQVPELASHVVFKQPMLHVRLQLCPKKPESQGLEQVAPCQPALHP